MKQIILLAVLATTLAVSACNVHGNDLSAQPISNQSENDAG
jgi:hypothetical protein